MADIFKLNGIAFQCTVFIVKGTISFTLNQRYNITTVR